MVKPNKFQFDRLFNLRELVIGVMKDMVVWNNYNLDSLYSINLGVLKRNATQRHGVTKWQKGVTSENLSLESIEVIELHPQLLDDERWNAYSAFVLYHEFIHALGFEKHNKEFRIMENSWPGILATKHGPEFTEYLRLKNAKWLWKCNSCLKVYPRKKPSKGRYKCRNCSVILVDVIV